LWLDTESTGTAAAGIGSGILFRSGGGIQAAQIAGIITNIGTSVEAGGLVFGTKGTGVGISERMRIDENGNVGIGTTQPTNGYKLDVRGGIISTDGILQNALYYENGYGRVGTRSDTPFQLMSDNTERVTIDTNGNVGIGTIGPETPLMVKRDNSVPGALTPLLKLQSDGAINEGPMIKFAATMVANVAKGFIAYQAVGDDYGANGNLLFGINPNNNNTDVSISDTKMVIKGNGNVGIGVDPGTNYKLEVSGGPIKATGGLIIHTCVSGSCPNDAGTPARGQMWLVE
jgi:hypothetical protein